MVFFGIEPCMNTGCLHVMKDYTIFFDDICVLCSRSVQFIQKYDSKGRFYFASLDSDAYREIAHLVPAGAPEPDSVILYRKGKIYLKSSAVLRIAARLQFPVNLLSAGWIIPRFIRNGLYDWIARNRYRWFGKRETCYMPDPKQEEHFLG